MRLTENQQRVLEELRAIGRENFARYQVKEPYLHARDRERVARGDQHCAFGLGGLTYQTGYRLGMTAGAVLSTFKALERKGLVIRETDYPEYQRPLYWWPVGLAAELAAPQEETRQV